jgi:hypothetical protein
MAKNQWEQLVVLVVYAWEKYIWVQQMTFDYVLMQSYTKI